MIRFRIGIGQYEHRSSGGMTWVRHLREVPARYTPTVQGDVDFSKLPRRGSEAFWDFVTILSCGFGVAVGHQNIEGSTASTYVFTTTDSGQQWIERGATQLIEPSAFSQAERFASLAVLSPGIVAIAWDDPVWDHAMSHVITSRDRGASWEYHCLGYSSPYLAPGFGGRLLALNDGYCMESNDGGSTWENRNFHIDWPHGYGNQKVALLRHVTFTTAEIGYALVVHWPPTSKQESHPDVGLLITTDSGLEWSHLHVFEGPNMGDINERHILDLRVA